MNREIDRNWDDDISGAVLRFKNSLVSGHKKYFDVSEFEGIVEQLLEEGDLESSEIAARQGMQMHPNAVQLQLKYAQVLISIGRYNEARRYLDIAERLEKNNPDVYLLKGSVWLTLGDEKSAAKAFGKAIKYAGGETDEILYHIASSYVQTGEIKKAITYLEKALRCNAGNELVLYDLAFFLDQVGDYQKSIMYYNRFIDIDPYNYTAWFNLGVVCSKAELYNEAIEAYEYTLAINDSFYLALFNIGNALANDGNFHEAIEKYKEYLEFEPENDDAFCYLAECYLNIDSTRKAEHYYHEAIDINPENDTAWFGIGLVYWVNEKYEESIRYIRKAIKRDNQNSEYWLTLGKVYKDTGRMQEAWRSFKKGSKTEAENTELWLVWAETLRESGEKETAVQVLKQAIAVNDDSMLKYRLVAFLLEDRKQKKAFEWLKIAMEQDFENLDYLFNIYPKSLKSVRLKKVVEEFKKENEDRT